MDFIKILDESIQEYSDDKPRHYIGASSVGHECMRHLYYGYHNLKGSDWSSKQKRTFEIGHRLESMVMDYIEQAGFKVIRPENDSPGIYCEDIENKFFRGHLDGILHLTDTHQVILEIKTASKDEYKKFINDGLLSWKPGYYSQLQSYMGMTGLKRSLIVVICKDNAEWQCEWVDYDDIHFNELRAKAKMIIEADSIPDRINQNPCFYKCQMCRYKDICHEKQN